MEIKTRQYNLNDLISGKHHQEGEGWIETPAENRVEALNAIKDYMRGATRSGSKNRRAVERMGLDNLPTTYGIFNRMVYDFSTKEAFYITGQDHTSEMGTMRDLIRKHC